MRLHPPTSRPAAPRDATTRPAAPGLAVLTALLLGVLGALASPAVATTAPGGVTAAGTATSDAPAYLRPAHLVPDLGAMDIRLAPFSDEGSGVMAEQRPVLETTAAYGAVGGYESMPPGRYAVSVRPEGTPTTTPPLLSLTLDLQAGQAYTVAGLGTKDAPRLELLDDDLTPPGDGRASVRLLAASMTAPVVDVQAVTGPVLGTDVRLGRPTAYDVAPAGPWTVRASGDGAEGSTDLVLDSGSVYTLLVLDGEAGALDVRQVVDAVGAGTTPVGGAAAGLGGGADPDAAAVVAPFTWLLVALAAATGLVLLRARPVPARVGGRHRGTGRGATR